MLGRLGVLVLGVAICCVCVFGWVWCAMVFGFGYVDGFGGFLVGLVVFFLIGWFIVAIIV